MKHLFKALILSICAVFCWLLPDRSWSRQESPTQQVDQIVSGVTTDKEPGIAVMVRKSGRTVFKRGYGMRDLRSNLPIDEHTNFRLASCSKQFTATAVILLVHDGKLHYEDRLTDIFPEFPAYGKDITIRNLLNHTAGLQSYEEILRAKYVDQPWERVPQIQDEGVLALLEEQTRTKFPPGTKWEYSNGGYEVLANVVRKVSGEAFEDFVQQRIFQPLNMKSSVVYRYGKNEVRNRAYGYTNDAGVWLETDQSTTSATLGDGAVYTSLDDLIEWDEEWTHHKLLAEDEFRPAITPVTLPGFSELFPNTDEAYGFGWFLDEYRGHKRVWHSGGTIGFSTRIERYPDDKLTIIMLANRTDISLHALSGKVADLYLAP